MKERLQHEHRELRDSCAVWFSMFSCCMERGLAALRRLLGKQQKKIKKTQRKGETQKDMK